MTAICVVRKWIAYSVYNNSVHARLQSVIAFMQIWPLRKQPAWLHAAVQMRRTKPAAWPSMPRHYGVRPKLSRKPSLPRSLARPHAQQVATLLGWKH